MDRLANIFAKLPIGDGLREAARFVLRRGDELRDRRMRLVERAGDGLREAARLGIL
jgi:hypothetical protein